MEPEQGGIDNSKSVRDMHHLRLMSLLQEQVRDHGRRRAAEILGVDRRTLDASLEQGLLTRRIRGALEKALQSGVGSAAAQQRDRNDKPEGPAGGPGGSCRENRARRCAPAAGLPRTPSGRCGRSRPRHCESWNGRWRSWTRRAGTGMRMRRRRQSRRQRGWRSCGGSTPSW